MNHIIQSLRSGNDCNDRNKLLLLIARKASIYHRRAQKAESKAAQYFKTINHLIDRERKVQRDSIVAQQALMRLHGKITQLENALKASKYIHDVK